MKIFLLAAVCTAAVVAATSIPVDANNRVAENLLLVRSTAPPAWLTLRAMGRRTLLVNEPDSARVFESDSVIAACIWQGFPYEHLNASINTAKLGEVDANVFVANECDRLELGFISYVEDETLKVTYVDENGVKASTHEKLRAGETNTVWIHTKPTHRFVVEGKNTKSSPSTFAKQEFVANVPGIRIVGTPPDYTALNLTISDASKLGRIKQELSRVNKVKRVFTDVGFEKIKVPRAVWAEISTYYYNNKGTGGRAREEWMNTGFFVNWHQRNQDLIVPPFALKARWLALLQPVLEQWSGTFPLEPTDIYGIRVYRKGAWLANHVDREHTHAVSGIINVDQVGIDRQAHDPWEVHIWDVHGRRHRVAMQPGEMLLYESARCLHGRPVPLQGEEHAEYANIFVHYRPRGNAQWFADEKVGRAAPDVSHIFNPNQPDSVLLQHEIGLVGDEASERFPATEKEEL